MATLQAQGSGRFLAQIAGRHAPRRSDGSSPPTIGWLLTIRAWIARQRQRKALGELAQLNDHLLRDIGISQHEARREAAKPFWRW
jgi:uncharacterized protein YjiS (DUF1127 family)